VTKLNFMAIYAKALVHMFTESNIRAAFTKTRIVPYNPDVITMEMMVPSLETSTTSHLPLGLASPLCELVDMISHHNAQKQKQKEQVESCDLSDPAIGSPNSSYTPVQQMLASLVTSASFLVSDSPTLSMSTLPPILSHHPQSTIQ
jgi:hypothetical protein